MVLLNNRLHHAVKLPLYIVSNQLWRASSTHTSSSCHPGSTSSLPSPTLWIRADDTHAKQGHVLCCKAFDPDCTMSRLSRSEGTLDAYIACHPYTHNIGLWCIALLSTNSSAQHSSSKHSHLLTILVSRFRISLTHSHTQLQQSTHTNTHTMQHKPLYMHTPAYVAC